MSNRAKVLLSLGVVILVGTVYLVNKTLDRGKTTEVHTDREVIDNRDVETILKEDDATLVTKQIEDINVATGEEQTSVEEQKPVEGQKQVEEQKQFEIPPSKEGNSATSSTVNIVVQKDEKEAEVKEPVKSPAKASSFWNNELATIVYNKSKTINTNCTDDTGYKVITKEALAQAFSIMDSFVGGNISADSARQQIDDLKYELAPGFNYKLRNVAVGSFVVDGLSDEFTIRTEIGNRSYSSHFLYVKIYYNAETNKSTVYFGSSSSSPY